MGVVVVMVMVVMVMVVVLVDGGGSGVGVAFDGGCSVMGTFCWGWIARGERVAMAAAWG